MNTELIAPIVNFSLVALTLIVFGRKPFCQYVESRSDGIKKAIDDAAALSNEAGKFFKEWQTRWNSLSQDLAQSKQDAEMNVKKFEVAALAAAAQESTRIAKDARLTGESEAQSAKVRLQQELAQKSIELAKTYLIEHVTDVDQESLVQQFIEKSEGGLSHAR